MLESHLVVVPDEKSHGCFVKNLMLHLLRKGILYYVLGPAHCHIMESDFLEMVVVHAACKNEYEKSKYFNILNILEIHCCS